MITMKRSQNLALFQVEYDHIAEAQTYLKNQMTEKQLALFYVRNESAKLPAEESYLSNEERDELKSLRSEERRTQFLISRWLSKNLLFSLLSIPVANILTVKGELGKPYLDANQNSLGIDFNISHTKEVTLVGITLGMQIGVDVEKISEKKNSENVAARFFKPDEIKWIDEGADHQEKLKRFFRIWSMKEAVIKTVGGGVFKNIHQICLKEEQGRWAFQSSAEPWSLREKWQLYEFDEIADHACSIGTYKP